LKENKLYNSLKYQKDMQKRGLSAIVIGGGIHGIMSAIELAKEGFKTTILEKNAQILQGTSGATHNRAHLGYHYPRSDETAKECLEGLKIFIKKYPSSIVYPKDSYYIINKKDSKVSPTEFKEFCKRINLKYNLSWPSERFCNKDVCEESFKVNEPIFDLQNLISSIEKEISELGIKEVTHSFVKGYQKTAEGHKLFSQEKGEEKIYEGNIIVNSTYAYSNNILKILGLEKDMTKYILEKTEVVLAKSNEKLPAMTIMDGEFISIMPFANSGLTDFILIYDVLNSRTSQEEGYFLKETASGPSNFEKMIERGKEYFPFMEKLEYAQSKWGYRPIPKTIIGDSRETRIISHKSRPGIYSIAEGKFISSILVAKRLINYLEKDIEKW